MHDEVQVFFTEVHDAFSFLEGEYLYRPPRDVFDEKIDWHYLQANVVYLSRKIAVGIIWYLLGGPEISVRFIELMKPYFLPIDPIPYSGGRSISLQIYAEMLGHADDPDFLIKLPTASKMYDRQNKRTIQSKRQLVVAGLARATRRYARSILLGDMSMFAKVLKYTHDR
jgi:hypothetical protein